MLLVQSVKGNEVIACTCEQGERAGVRAGMTAAHAGSLLRGYRIHREPYDPDKDVHHLQRLARWSLRFSPLAAADEPSGLLLNIAGCAHLYGGERKLAERVGTSLHQLGLDARLAVAPTFACAQAVARCASEQITIVEKDAREALNPLPIAALRVCAQTCDSLKEVGIERIGQLFEFPRAELAARFDGALTRRLDQALGLGTGEILEPIRPVEPLEASRVFEGPVISWEAIQTTCHELLAELVHTLGQKESGVCSLTYWFHRIDSAAVPLSVRLAHPSRDFKHLWSLLRPRLEQVQVGYGIEEIRLCAEREERIEHGQVELWPDLLSTTAPPHESSWQQLLDHLMERLGLDNVRVAQPAEAYAPEQGYPLQPWSRSADASVATYTTERPSRLFSPPEPARVMTVTPDGPLVWLHWRGRERRVYRSMGPERISLPWWGTSSVASTRLFRDYYMIMDMEGECLWVYRDGQTSAWFVHGEWT